MTTTDTSEDEIIDPQIKYDYPDTGSHYAINEFVYCHFQGPQGQYVEDFGEVVNYIPPDRYIVKLATFGGFANVPIESVRKAGRA